MSKAASFAGRIFATALGTKLALSVLGLWFWYNSRVTFASFRPELELEGISIRIGYRVPYWLRIPSPIGKLGGSARIWCECQLDTLDISWSLSSMFSDPGCWHGCFTVVRLCFLMNPPWCSCWWRLTSGIDHASSRWISDANRKGFPFRMLQNVSNEDLFAKTYDAQLSKGDVSRFLCPGSPRLLWYPAVVDLCGRNASALEGPQ